MTIICFESEEYHYLTILTIMEEHKLGPTEVKGVCSK